MDEVRQEIEKLREEIREHDRRYYEEDKPSISDLQYDKLMERLKLLEANHPDLVSSDSPTQRVGGKPIAGFRSVTHTQRMYSIDNTYNADDLRKWASRIYESTDAKLLAIYSEINAIEGSGKEATKQRKNLRSKYDEAIDEAGKAGFPIVGGYYVDPKVDGVAINLRYEDDKLSVAATRGDGQRGDDVTQNIRTIRAIPLALRSDKNHEIPEIVEIRGEIYMPTAEFERINLAVIDAGQEPFANPRNATAGTLKQLDPQVVAQRRLNIIAHGRGEITDDPFATHSEFLRTIADWGIPVNGFSRQCKTIDEVWQYIEDFSGQRSELPYQIDGVVVRVDRIDLQNELGYTSKSPRWCIAYKYAAEQATTKLLRVDWQVGKTGKLTPRATMEPVFVAGTTVQHATLHNLGEIRRKDIRQGDYVVIEKAGEIIPQVMHSIPSKRDGTQKTIEPPTICPECGGEIKIDFDSSDIEKETARYCINPECPAQFRERLIHYVGRKQMDIRGLGEEVVDQLIAANLVSHLSDLYTLKEEQLADLTHKSTTSKGKEVAVRMGEKKSKQIVLSLKQSKSRGLGRVLASIGIHHIGSETARVIASRVSNIDELISMSEEEVRTVVRAKASDSKFKMTKKSAVAFFESLHSFEGKQRIEDATNARRNDLASSEVLLFLDELPEGPKWGRLKWGDINQPGSGRGRKDRILQSYSTLEELGRARLDEFVELFDDEVVGHTLYEFLHSSRGAKTIESLRAEGVRFDSVDNLDKGTMSAHGFFTGKTVVVTGTLKDLGREEAHELIRLQGGKTTSSVSKSTDFLIVGENPGSNKLEQARKLNVSVINEKEFNNLIADMSAGSS